MRPQERQGSRRSRGGARRRGGHGRSNGSPAPHRETFWQKLVAFFTGRKTNAAASKDQRTGNRRRMRWEGEERSERSAARPVRKPEVIEVSSPKLYVGNLSFDATENDLFDLFNGVGKVQNAEIVSHKYTQKSKGFSFVTMTSVEEAKRAVTELHDKEFMGRKLVVSGAKTADVRHSGDSKAA